MNRLLLLGIGFLTFWMIAGTISFVYSSQKNRERNLELLQKINETDEKLVASYDLLLLDLTNERHKVDILQGKVEVLDESVYADKKQKVRIAKTADIIKQMLPGANPLPGCPNNPTPGEIWAIAGAIVDNSNEYSVPASLIAAVIRQESAFCNLAHSSAGARGYMQLMPETAAAVAADVTIKNRRVLSIWKGRDNIQLGTAYLSAMMIEFNGDIELTIKAYNSGPVHIKRVLAGEQELYKETTQYAKHVLEFKKEFERLGL